MILYLHIPFCTSKCGYCAFNSSSDFFHLQDAYIEALVQDLKYELNGKNYTLNSIFIGGGTPNTLESRHYAKIFENILQYAHVLDQCEITLECNPNLLNKQWCRDLLALGATRLSVGIQSFFDQKLRFLQREHQSKEIVQSLQDAYDCGFTNLSIDLIYGTPMDSPYSLIKEVESASVLPINHLSAYSLSIDKGSRFYTSPPILPIEDMGDILREELGKHGFLQYEVSNFSRPYRCLHNLSYWKGEEYIGCGAGAVGYVENTRYTKLKHIPSYIKNPYAKSLETLTSQEKFLEQLFLGLRCDEGVRLDLLSQAKVSLLLEEKKAYIQNGRLKAVDFFLADEIALFLS